MWGIYNDDSPGVVKKPWLVMCADFHGVNTPTVVDFKLPTQRHWMWSCDEMHTISFL